MTTRSNRLNCPFHHWVYQNEYPFHSLRVCLFTGFSNETRRGKTTCGRNVSRATLERTTATVAPTVYPASKCLLLISVHTHSVPS